MSSRAWVDEKLQAWLAAVEGGRQPSLEELCSGDPPPSPDDLRLLQQAIDNHLQTAIDTDPQPDCDSEATQSSAIPKRIGRYRIDGVLGEGGFGRVYLGMDEQLERRVAIKVPRRDRLVRPEDVQEYLKEARALAKLEHPQIIAVYDVGTSKDTPCYFVSKFIDGRTLADRLRNGPMPRNEALALVAAVADVLHYSHLQKFVHRDVKPSNILLDQTGRPYLADFGLALADVQWGTGPTIVGTLAYMSPEQAGGKGHLVDGRSDIYSLGAVLYELLCGRPPLVARRKEEQRDLIVNHDPKPPRMIDDGIPAELERICLKALAKRPADRYTTAKDFADELRRCVASLGATPPSPPAPSAQAEAAPAPTRSAARVASTLAPRPTIVEGRLPCPLAQLSRRTRNAKSAIERHLGAVSLFEATLKLLGSIAIVEYAETGKQDEKVQERLCHLARPSLGHWWEFVRVLTPVLAANADAGFEGVQACLRSKRGEEFPQAVGLDQVIREVLTGERGSQTTVRLPELFDRLVQYRNQQIGHGATGSQTADHHDRVARAMFSGLSDIFRSLDVLAGRRLLYVDGVNRGPAGEWLVDALDLSGREPERLPPARFSEDRAPELPKPKRLYVTREGVANGFPSSFVELHPLMTYDSDSEESFFLNARRGRRDVEYLCYSSGRPIRAELIADRRELLGRILNLSVSDESADRWAAESLAEEDSQGAPPAGDASRTRVGEFELISRLGKGGMGVVYRALQPSLDREVALKCLLRTGDAKSQARFAREIRALGRVDHPNLVRVYTSGVAGDQWFHAMELIDGMDLSDVVERLSTDRSVSLDEPQWERAVSTAYEQSRTKEEPIGSSAEHEVAGDLPDAEAPVSGPPLRVRLTDIGYIRRVVDLIRQVALATQELHTHKVLHRDIKPGNIRLLPDGKTAVLMDLGLAKLIDDADGKLTRTHQFLGTLRYASPEQVAGIGPLDFRTDVYSLGATLWELLTLRPLFDMTRDVPHHELIRRVQVVEPTLPSRFNPAVPAQLDVIVDTCLQKDANLRYESAKKFADDLQSWLNDELPSVGPRTVGYRVRRFFKKRRKLIAIVSMLVMAQLALIAGLMTREPRSPADSLNAVSNDGPSHPVVPPVSPNPARPPERFALLIGCTRYSSLPAIRHLKGPANDVAIIYRALEGRFGIPDANIRILAEPDHFAAAAEREGIGRREPTAVPTAANIRQEFQRLAATVQPGDSCFVLLDGHSSSEPDQDESEQEYEAGYDEVFLPSDIGDWKSETAHVENSLSDDQISEWISAIVQRGASVFCLSDSPCVDTPRVTAAGGRFVALYDSLENQDSYEFTPIHPGPRYGVLAYAVSQALYASEAPPSYRQLFAGVMNLYSERGYLDRSSPSIEGLNLDSRVLNATTWAVPAETATESHNSPESNVVPKSNVASRRALLVGCTRYPNLPAEYQLEGPANDVELMRRLLIERFGFEGELINSLTETAGPDRLPTRANIRAAFGDLARDAQPGDVCFVFLAGQGSQQPDVTADQAWDPEDDGLDEVFLPRDAGVWRDDAPGISNALVDDDLESMLSVILSRGAEVFVVVDACYSGGPHAASDAVRMRFVPPVALGVPAPGVHGSPALPAPGASAEVKLRGLVSVNATTGRFEVAVEDRPTAVRPAYGRLTLALYQILQHDVEPLTYRQLATRLLDVHTDRNWHLWGLPSWYHAGDDFDDSVLGQDQPAPPRELTVRRLDDAWTVNLGRLDGLYPSGVLAARASEDAAAVEEYFTIRSSDPFSAVATPVTDETAAPTTFDVATGRVVYRGTDDARLGVRVVAQGFANEDKEHRDRQQLELLLREEELNLGAVVRLVESEELPEWLAIATPDGVLLQCVGSDMALDDPMAVRIGHVIGPIPLDEGELLIRNLKRVRAGSRFIAFAGRERTDPSAEVGIDVRVHRMPAGGTDEELMSPTDDATAAIREGDVARIVVENVGLVDVQVTVIYLDSAGVITVQFPHSTRDLDNISPGASLPKDITLELTDDTVGWEHVIVIALPAGDRDRFARLQEMLQMAVEETKPSIEQRGVTRIEEPPADLEFDPVRRLIRDALGLPSPAIRPEDVAGQQRFAIRRVSWKVVADPSR